MHGQALNAMGRLRHYLVRFPNMSISHKLDLFDKLIEPVLTYGCEVWGMNNENKLESIHLLFCKQILGVRRQTQNSFIYGELGRYPLKIKRLSSVLKYWFKVIRSPDEKIIKHVYNVMLNDLEVFPNKISWTKFVKYILESNGFYNVWLNQGVEDTDFFMKIFIGRIKSTKIQNFL